MKMHCFIKGRGNPHPRPALSPCCSRRVLSQAPGCIWMEAPHSCSCPNPSWLHPWWWTSPPSSRDWSPPCAQWSCFSSGTSGCTHTHREFARCRTLCTWIQHCLPGWWWTTQPDRCLQGGNWLRGQEGTLSDDDDDFY